MTQNISVQYFPPKGDAKPSDLGGGYVTSGILKTSFRLVKTDKNEHGFFPSFPSKKNETTGEWKELVEFPNGEAKEQFIALVKDKIQAGGGNRPTQATGQRPATAATANNIARQKPPAMGVPGETGIPW